MHKVWKYSFLIDTQVDNRPTLLLIFHSDSKERTRMFTQVYEDTIDGLQSSINFYIVGFQDLKEEEGSQDGVRQYRRKAELALQTTDEHMTALLLKQENSQALLTNWAARLNSCRHMLDILDKNLAFQGKRQWDWDDVIQAMSFIEAVTKGAQGTLMENGVDL